MAKILGKKNIIERHISRRQFLVGAGAGLLLPQLTSLWPKSAMAATSALTPVRRVCLLATEFGMHTSHIAPSDLNLGSAMKQMSVNSGLTDLPYGRFSPLTDIPKVGGGYSYIAHSGLADLFPFMNLYRGLDKCAQSGHNWGLFSGSIGGRNPTHGRSIDYIIEESAAFRSAFKGNLSTIRMINARYKGPIFYSRKRDASGNFINGEDGVIRPDFQVSDGFIFDSLFKVAAPDSASSVDKKTKLIDRVLSDFNALKNSSKLSKADRKLLLEYGESIYELESKLILPSDKLSCTSPVVSPQVKSSRDSVKDLSLFSDNIFKMAVVAFSCDLSRMLCYHYFPFDSMHHSADDNPNEYYGSKHQKTFVDIMADKLVRKLRDTKDPFNSGSLLDNSLVLFANEHSGRSHSPNDIPLITFGSLGNQVRSGYFMDFRKEIANSNSGGYPLKQMMISIMRSMGVSSAEYMKEGDGKGFGSWGNYTNVAFNRYNNDFFNGRHNEPLPFFTKT